ncbi:hypothetical protein JOD69_004437 [Methylocaldum sp. RMAD-M]|nr:hypothetical protein [Methylocaldum sp. RMAD-M]
MNRFGRRHQPAVGVVGVGVEGLLAGVGQGYRVPGAVEVVNVKGVGLGLDQSSGIRGYAIPPYEPERFSVKLC